MKRFGAALVLASGLSFLTVGAVRAVNPEEQLSNPQQEARARAISRELRCVVCQSQTIDDSSAPVAQALRKLVRDRIVAGDSDRQVVAAVTARYGDFVLLKPRFDATTSILWLGPFAVLGLGAVGAVVYVRRQEALPDEPAPLTEAERTALAQTLTALTSASGRARSPQDLEISAPLHPPS
jgi:cytochrome c-type biogenesis protein CcmH